VLSGLRAAGIVFLGAMGTDWRGAPGPARGSRAAAARAARAQQIEQEAVAAAATAASAGAAECAVEASLDVWKPSPPSARAGGDAVMVDAPAPGEVRDR
jgi:hypothetical protein